jgi:osmoprotectant transport system substrate-binding protein
LLILGLVGLLLFSFGCTMGGEDRSTLTEKGPIIVASKIDTEGALLGQIIIAMLKANGYNVVDKTEFGPTDIIRKAILNGEIDIYPEYTGNGAFFFSQTDPEIWKNSTKGYEAVKRLDLEKNQVVWLRPAPANNTWAIAVRKDLSQQEDMKTKMILPPM